MSQVTCLTLVNYSGIKSKIWAFGMMQFGHKHLANLDGLEFYKLMGSGKGDGFNPYPDWSTYSLLTVWSSQEQLDQFLDRNSLIDLYQGRGGKLTHYILEPIKSHGMWSGVNPFKVNEDAGMKPDDNICVITRATIKWNLLRRFWKYVPTSKQPLLDNPDLIYTKGIGEVPFLQMATFSVWTNLDALKRFAYQSKEHGTAIKMTRQLNWYKEELFARFKLLETRVYSKS